jgi:hypothetical protein
MYTAPARKSNRGGVAAELFGMYFIYRYRTETYGFYENREEY